MVPSCNWVPAQEANTILDVQVMNPTSGGPGLFVTYTHNASTTMPNVVIVYEAHMTKARFESDESEGSAHQLQPIAGLGDDAYALSGPELIDDRTFPLAIVNVLDGSVSVSVEGPATAKQLQTLATRILLKL